MKRSLVNHDRQYLKTPDDAFEQILFAEYLVDKGYRKADLDKLPKSMVKSFKREAYQYVGLK